MIERDVEILGDEIKVNGVSIPADSFVIQEQNGQLYVQLFIQATSLRVNVVPDSPDYVSTTKQPRYKRMDDGSLIEIQS